MPTYNQDRQAGVVSLFTVIFFTILITVLTVGFVRIMINESRQSTDNDLSSRAYYAAESGIEDAKRALQQYYPDPTQHANLNADICDAPVGYNKTIATNPNVGYSCMLMDLTPPSIEAALPGNGNSLQWKLQGEGDAHFNRIRISWHSLTNEADGTPVVFRDDNNNPSYSAWNSGGTSFPAMIRLQLFGLPKTGPFGRAELEARNKVGFLNPANSDAPGNAPILLSDLDPSSGSKPAPRNIKCTTNEATNGGYACRALINIEPVVNPNNDNLFLRLKSLYDPNGTQVKIELMNGTNVVNTESGQALVDVTGRAGDVFRRVQSRVSLSSDTGLLPEFAVESGDSICKRFELTDTGETLNGCAVR